jgi:hypothetical protein
LTVIGHERVEICDDPERRREVDRIQAPHLDRIERGSAREDHVVAGDQVDLPKNVAGGRMAGCPYSTDGSLDLDASDA